jgi:hypothetical protein
MSDLFDAFEAGTMHPISPAIARDGGIVLTGD